MDPKIVQHNIYKYIGSTWNVVWELIIELWFLYQTKVWIFKCVYQRVTVSVTFKFMFYCVLGQVLSKFMSFVPSKLYIIENEWYAA